MLSLLRRLGLDVELSEGVAIITPRIRVRLGVLRLMIPPVGINCIFNLASLIIKMLYNKIRDG